MSAISDEGRAAPLPWHPPDAFDEFRLQRSLGRGGMGQVFLARDTHLDRAVAIKFINAPRPDPRARQRFLIEARAVARLQHPNVVSLFRTGEVEGRPFLVSEYVRGRSLNLLRGPLPPQQVLRIGLGLARGLAAAHRQGVLHRDIKPANAILSEDGEVKLLDFGLAKLVSAQPDPNHRRSIPPVDAAHRKQEAAHAIPDHASPWPTGIAPAVTLAGAVVGTPRYMAPELWSNEPANRRTDVYSLGAVLYELYTGAAPAVPRPQDSASADEPTTSQSQGRAGGPPSPSPRLVDSPLSSRLFSVIDTCLHQEPSHRYPDGDALREALERLVASQESHGVPLLPPGNPYRGLLPFEAEHRALFFGRGAEARAVLERLRHEPALVITGDSGVGKSSLCRAAVLPALSHGEAGVLDLIGGGMCCLRLTPGRRPLRALAAVLRERLALTTPAVEREPMGETFIHVLTRQPQSLPRWLLAARAGCSGVVLFVDQLEELVTLAEPEEAAAFAAALAELAMWTPELRLLCTARADFLARLLLLPGLADFLPRALYGLRPLSESQVREAIIGPAQRAGLRFEPESLVGELAAEAVRTPGGLPLLQFALAELWEVRDVAAGRIHAAALVAIGGLGGALARHAEAVLAALSLPQREAARDLLTRLVLPDGARARCTEAELRTGAPARGALAALVNGRLVVAREVAGEAIYELAHEALVQGWARLRDWLATDAELRALERRLRAAAGEWERLRRAPEALWGPRQLREARLLPPRWQSPLETTFLLASRRSVQRRRLLRDLLLALVPLLILGGLLVTRVLSERSQQRAVAAQETLATAALQRAHDRDAVAVRLRAGSVAGLSAAPRDDAAATRDYAEALHAEQEAHAAYARATGALEAALLIDPRRRDLRDRLTLALVERVALLSAFCRHDLSEELTQRVLALEGPAGGKHSRRLSAPARLLITADAPNAVLSLERFESPAHPYREELPAPRLGQPVLLPPGSYRVTFRSAGRARVYLPILLSPGEQRDVSLALPRAAAVPAGYAYVPPGGMLYGSADAEALRRFLMAPPQHPLSTGAFLIAQTEVTFAEWLQYLRALPVLERARRLPRSEGALELSEGHDGLYTLRLKPSAITYQAREGDPLRFQGRGARSLVDWRRLPVAGINLKDAEAYLEWLSRSGRLRGARLCTDTEWERAARGADGRLFPHGDELHPDDAAFDETYGRDPRAYGPDEVMAHPASVSPFGVFDLAGNVFEPVRAGEGVAYRGGSWYLSRLVARSNNRDPGDPAARDPQVGLRVCATPESLAP